jgi:branched-chain amino acid transport system permease protein
MINIVLAGGLNIVKGFAGQVNVGHVALAAIGAYTSAVLSTKFGISFWFALPLATIATGLVGAIVGVPSSRLEGAYLALATLGLAESVRMFIGVADYLGASVGFGGIPPPMIGDWRLDGYGAYYYVVMPITVTGTYVASSIHSSRRLQPDPDGDRDPDGRDRRSRPHLGWRDRRGGHHGNRRVDARLLPVRSSSSSE